MLNRLRQPIALAVIAYLFITLVIMLPVTLHLNKMLFALPGDPYGTLYSLWQSRSAWPSMTFPNAPFLVTTTTILARIFGEVAAFNLILISGYVLTGLAGFLIGRKVAKNALAAFFVGLILMLSPYHVSRSLQHLGLANIEWLIFFIWSLLLFNENPKISRGALVGLFFSITMLDSYIYGLFAIVIILAYGLSALVQSACHYRNIVIKPTKIIGVMAGIVLAIALTVPPLLPVLNPLIHTGSSASQTVTSNRSFEELKVYGARWFAYVLPTPDSPIFGQYNEAKYTDSLGQSGSNLTELSVYLGWTTMLLAIFGLATLLLNKTNQETSVKFTALFAFLIAILGLFFSFSPTMTIGSLVIKTPANYIYSYIPFMRVYSRLGLLVLFGTAILAGLGLDQILRAIKNNQRKFLVAEIIFCFAIMELLIWPPHHTIMVDYKNMPTAYKQIPENSRIVEYPFFTDGEPMGEEYLLWDRLTSDYLINNDSSLSTDERLALQDPKQTSAISFLQSKDVKYILVHHELYTPALIRKQPGATTGGTIPVLTNPHVNFVGSFDSIDVYKLIP